MSPYPQAAGDTVQPINVKGGLQSIQRLRAGGASWHPGADPRPRYTPEHARAIFPGMITIRPATASDQERLGRFGGALMRQHHTADTRRFIQVEHPEAGYGWFLVSQLSNPNSLVLVAEHSGTIIGYVFADVEATNWMELRGPCGVVHDVYVDGATRVEPSGPPPGPQV